jgi:hypothetical protein
MTPRWSGLISGLDVVVLGRAPTLAAVAVLAVVVEPDRGDAEPLEPGAGVAVKAKNVSASFSGPSTARPMVSMTSSPAWWSPAICSRTQPPASVSSGGSDGSRW